MEDLSLEVENENEASSTSAFPGHAKALNDLDDNVEFENLTFR